MPWLPALLHWLGFRDCAECGRWGRASQMDWSEEEWYWLRHNAWRHRDCAVRAAEIETERRFHAHHSG